jgi:hypothetical protein
VPGRFLGLGRFDLDLAEYAAVDNNVMELLDLSHGWWPPSAGWVGE